MSIHTYQTRKEYLDLFIDNGMSPTIITTLQTVKHKKCFRQFWRGTIWFLHDIRFVIIVNCLLYIKIVRRSQFHILLSFPSQMRM